MTSAPRRRGAELRLGGTGQDQCWQMTRSGNAGTRSCWGQASYHSTPLSSLVVRALESFAERCVRLVSVVTQGSKVAAQRLYQGCGFATSAVELWYHRWFAPRPDKSVP